MSPYLSHKLHITIHPYSFTAVPRFSLFTIVRIYLTAIEQTGTEKLCINLRKENVIQDEWRKNCICSLIDLHGRERCLVT
jgi:hypothetical protein